MIYYQLAIIITFIGAKLFFGVDGVKIASVLWLCETIVMIFTPWLGVFQGVNIYISFMIGCIVAFFEWYHSKSKLERDCLKRIRI